MVATWRAQSRDILRSELALTATDIFATDGFDEVTVDDLVQRLGISRATFFRYFAGKVDAVLATMESEHIGNAGHLEEVLDSLDPATEESAWSFVKRVLHAATDQTMDDPLTTRRRVRLVMTTPALRVRFRETHLVRENRLADRLQPLVTDRLAAESIAAAALAGLDVAWRTWASDNSEDRPLADLLNQVINAFEEAGNPINWPTTRP